MSTPVRINQVQGLLGNVRAASPVDVTVGGLFADIDDVILAAGDKVLLTAQANPVENGLYEYNGSTVERPAKGYNVQAGYDELPVGSIVYVEEGTQNADKYFYISGTDSIAKDGYGNKVLTVDTNTQVYSELAPVEPVRGELLQATQDPSFPTIWSVTPNGVLGGITAVLVNGIMFDQGDEYAIQAAPNNNTVTFVVTIPDPTDTVEFFVAYRI